MADCQFYDTDDRWMSNLKVFPKRQRQIKRQLQWQRKRSQFLQCLFFNYNFLVNDLILYPFMLSILTNADNSENYWLFISVAPCRRRSSSKSQIFSLHHRPPFQAGLVFPSVKSFFPLFSRERKKQYRLSSYGKQNVFNLEDKFAEFSLHVNIKQNCQWDPL